METPGRGYGKDSASNTFDDVLSPETARRLYAVTDSVSNEDTRVSDASQSSGRNKVSANDMSSPLSESQRLLESLATVQLSSQFQDQGPEDAHKLLGVADDSELDASLIEDPCVVCYDDKIVFRSCRGTCIAVGAQKSQVEVSCRGNPTENASEFVLVGTALRTQSGIVKHGDVVSIMSKSNGRYLGVYDDDEDSDVQQPWKIQAKRKVVGRREHWVVVEIENDTVERESERKMRVAASTARVGLRAKQLGYNLQQKQLAPHRKEVQVSLRSSDMIYLRSVHVDSLYLCCYPDESLGLTADIGGIDCEWAAVKVPSPFVPMWARTRKLLNGTLSPHANRENSTDKVNTLQSRSEVEAQLVDCLLFAMAGIESELVVQDTRVPEKWVISSGRVFDKSLQHLASLILPMCGQYVTTNDFILRRSRAEFGRVSHALAAAMRNLLREYQVLIAQLENQQQMHQLTLQKLWFYVQPSMRTLQTLSTVAKKSATATGGSLLNVIHKLASRGGDAKSRSVYHYLVQNATVPYLEMLELWIYHGVIRDPYDEFMVCVDEDTTKRTLRDDFNARYWDARYTLREQRHTGGHTPVSAGSPSRLNTSPTWKGGTNEAAQSYIPFFLLRIADKILTTGKYLNVVRECGRWVTNPCAEHIPYSDESYAYDQIVTRAHDYASRTLLSLLLEEEQLVARLRSLKHYFLLDQGDFFVHFMDIAHGELQKPVEEIAVTRLQSLLEMCLRVRDVNDPFQEDLACELVPYTLIQHVEAIHDFAGGDLTTHSPVTPAMTGLHGVDAFTLDFKVRWPLSLVLSRQALTKYQLIFRHLFFCKHVERQLCTTWLAHQTTKELNLRSALGPDYCLRQRMLHFLQNFEYYVMFEVLEPRWHELEQRLVHVKTVDELMKHHAGFLDTCLRECLLTHQGLLKTLAKIMTTCLLFAEQIGRFADQIQVDEASIRKNLEAQKPKKKKGGSKPSDVALRRTRIKVQEQHIRGIVTQESYRQMIRRSQTTFDTMLNTFMDDLLKEATHGEYHS
eukprot:CAMPEP_0203759020 /NCGR_PEP_ID=MMETSP0098-20131031/11951_1 /ASSEMBLY_ACC=CAM_ASM_000208 /TAXON_ID=96639 /ORGANISM=" , Strain NY0313808BC1" /LENGTH=1021 /DNA_ID=CAMNT_0050651747 /DNA_START=232 /DNA_END=3294 /DNA_ORIENTATION=+